jgi:hypothetical protein
MNARHVSGLLLLVAGCSVPGRDNPLDPQNRLSFAAYLRLPGGEHCNAGSWGATWTLDATAAHTFATWLLSDGADLRWTQQQLGHASIGQTADTYGHVQPDRHEAAVNGLDQYLKS